MNSIALRSRQTEMMEEATLSSSDLAQALRGIATLHRITFTAPILARVIRRVAGGSDQITVGDFGCGNGELLCAVGVLLKRHYRDVRLIGIDINKTTIEKAKAYSVGSRCALPREFIACDILKELPPPVDVVFSALTLHHLPAEDVEQLYRAKLAWCKKGVITLDLLRSYWGLGLAWVGGRLFTRSRVVHNDAPLSVRRSYTLDEVRSLALAIPCRRQEVYPVFPARFIMTLEP